MINVLTGVLVVGGLYVVYLIMQLVLWTLIAVQSNIPWIVCSVLFAYCFRKFLIYKRSVN
jgi:hypothetical protein